MNDVNDARYLTDAYDRTAAMRRLADDVGRMPRPPVLARPRINTFRAYDPTRPVNRQRAAVSSPYVDAPPHESFWLLLIGCLVFAVFAWLAWMTNSAV